MWNVTEPFSEVDVAVFAEGTYPYARGGVSSVIHRLIEGTPELSFGVIHLCWDGESLGESQFAELPNLRWVKPIFLSPTWGKGGKGQKPPAMKLDRKSLKLLGQVLKDLGAGNYAGLEQFYRRHPGWLRDVATESSPLLTHIPFLKMMVEEYFGEGLSYLDALWMSHEFTGLLTKLLAQDYPKAKVYHSHTNGYAGLAAILAKWQNGGKFLMSEHALYVRDAISFIPGPSDPMAPQEQGTAHFPTPIAQIRRQKWEAWFRRLGHFVYQHIDASVYLYDGAFKEAKSYGYPTGAIEPHIIPNGIDLAAFKPLREAQLARNVARRDSSYIWTIGFIGRIVPIKGVLEFIDVIAALARRKELSAEFRVLFVGPTTEDPEYFRRCLAKIRRLGLGDMVFFTGTQNVQDVLGHIDVVTIPSLSEAFPMVCLEAMACGIPIVANDVGCIRDILSSTPRLRPRLRPRQVPALGPGQSRPALPPPPPLAAVAAPRSAGAVVPKSSPLSFTDRLHHLLTTPKTYQRFQQEGPKIIEARYRSSGFLQRYRDLYEKLLGTRLAPKPAAEKVAASYEYLKPNILQGKS